MMILLSEFFDDCLERSRKFKSKLLDLALLRHKLPAIIVGVFQIIADAGIGVSDSGHLAEVFVFSECDVFHNKVSRRRRCWN